MAVDSPEDQGGVVELRLGTRSTPCGQSAHCAPLFTHAFASSVNALWCARSTGYVCSKHHFVCSAHRLQGQSSAFCSKPFSPSAECPECARPRLLLWEPRTLMDEKGRQAMQWRHKVLCEVRREKAAPAP